MSNIIAHSRKIFVYIIAKTNRLCYNIRRKSCQGKLLALRARCIRILRALNRGVKMPPQASIFTCDIIYAENLATGALF